MVMTMNASGLKQPLLVYTADKVMDIPRCVTSRHCRHRDRRYSSALLPTVIGNRNAIA